MTEPTQTHTMPTRHIALSGAFNLRDTGGYETADGRRTRWRTLLRSDSLHHLTPEDQQLLQGLGIATVIDLRYEREVVEKPNVFAASPHVLYCHVPLLPSSPSADVAPPADLVEVYKLILDSVQPAIRQVIQTVLEPDGAPVIVHCTAGKDRTGMTVALMLGAVGVSPAQIVADYALTEHCIQPLLVELRKSSTQIGIDAGLYEKMLACTPDLMEAALQYIDQRYGSIPAYLMHIGIESDELAKLRHILVEDGSSK